MPELYNMRDATMVVRRYAVRIDRKTKWGNPFVIGKHGTREEVIAKYEAWLRSKPDLMLAVKLELAGKDLLCWCAPLPCHGDVLLRIANDIPEGRGSLLAGALESGSPHAVAREANPGSAVPGGVAPSSTRSKT